MRHHRDSWSVQFACATYARWLRILPKEFRASFGQEMLQVFASSARACFERGGTPALAGLLARDLCDLVRSAAIEQMEARMRRSKTQWGRFVACLSLALACAVVAGWTDNHSPQLQGPVLLIAGAAFVLSLIEPRRAWLWAALLGLSIPASHVLVRLSSSSPALFGVLTLPYPGDSYASTFLALISAAAGAGSGALIRAWARDRRQRAQG